MSGAFGGFVFGGSGSGAPGSGRDFLNLCQRTAVECGVASNSAIQTALPTVADATGSLGRVVGWVNDAWTDIQTDRDDWYWLRSSAVLGSGAQFQTVAGQPNYQLGIGAGTVGVDVEEFGKWAEGSFRCMPTAVGVRGEARLGDISYDAWRESYMFGATRLVQTRPVVLAIGPDQSLCLGPPPLAGYSVTGDYFTAPTLMVADTDIPYGIPVRFQMLIVYRAMMKYGGYESAPEVYQRGKEENDTLYAQLLRARVDRPRVAGALA